MSSWFDDYREEYESYRSHGYYSDIGFEPWDFPDFGKNISDSVLFSIFDDFGEPSRHGRIIIGQLAKKLAYENNQDPINAWFFMVCELLELRMIDRYSSLLAGDDIHGNPNQKKRGYKKDLFGKQSCPSKKKLSVSNERFAKESAPVKETDFPSYVTFKSRKAYDNLLAIPFEYENADRIRFFWGQTILRWNDRISQKDQDEDNLRSIICEAAKHEGLVLSGKVLPGKRANVLKRWKGNFYIQENFSFNEFNFPKASTPAMRNELCRRRALELTKEACFARNNPLVFVLNDDDNPMVVVLLPIDFPGDEAVAMRSAMTRCCGRAL